MLRCAKRLKLLFQPDRAIPSAVFEARFRKFCRDAVADGAVKGKRRLVCRGDDGVDLAAALPAKKVLDFRVQLSAHPPAAGLLRQIAGDFRAPAVGSAFKGQAGIGLA